MRKSGLRSAALLCLLAAPAAAEIYRWTDGQGQVHFTEDLSQVPASQRPSAVERTLQAPEQGRVSTYSASEAQGPSPRTGLPAALAPGEPGGAQRVHRIRVERAGTAMVVAARVNDGLTVPFVVDTGASDVLLPLWAAEKLGLEASGRTREYLTANGTIEAPVVMLDAVELGGARVENVPASVSGNLQVGLLGLSFFNHFTTHVDAAQGILTLVPNDLAETGGIRGGRSEAQWRAEFGGLRERLARLEAEGSRTNPNASSKRDALERAGEETLRQLEILEAEADQARVPMSWRE